MATRRRRPGTAARRRAARRWGLLAALSSLFLGALAVAGQVKELGGAVAAIQPLVPEKEQIALSFSILPYDIQTGPTGAAISLDAARGELQELRQRAPDVATAIARTIQPARQPDLEATLELSGYTLRSSVPLTMVVAERALNRAVQALPGQRELGPEGTDLGNFFRTGGFLGQDCQCIEVSFRDAVGRFDGGSIRIYAVEGEPSFAPQARTRSLQVTLRHQPSVVVFLSIRVDGASPESAARARSVLEQALKDELARQPFVRLAPYATREEIEQRARELQEIPPGPEKGERIADATVDYLVSGTAVVSRERALPGF